MRELLSRRIFAVTGSVSQAEDLPRCDNMAKSINVRQKKRSRPATRQAPIIGVRLSEEILLDLDQWAVDNDLTRSAAIRLLIESALREAAGKPLRGNVTRPSSRKRRD